MAVSFALLPYEQELRTTRIGAYVLMPLSNNFMHRCLSSLALGQQRHA